MADKTPIEARDTVMNSTEIVKATWINPYYSQDSPVMRLASPAEVGTAQAQAKISFEKGRQLERERIIEFIDWLDDGLRSSPSWRSEVRKYRRALKEGKDV